MAAQDKKAIAGPHIRTAYYGVSDNIGELEDSVQLSRDPEADRIIKELREKADELQKHLNKEYLWD